MSAPQSESSGVVGGRLPRVAVAAVLVAALLGPGAAGPADAVGPPPQVRAPGLERAVVRAGVARVDASWHVGASAGQYASDGTSVGDHGVDPSLHSTRRSSSYGVQSRSDVRALVVEGADGERVAIVANDLYIPQDLVNRRVGTILEQRDQRISLGLEAGHLTGITEDNMVVSVSHSHSSAYYSTPSWGVWAFQDVFDLRFFEYIAQKMADAVVAASETLVPVRMGAARVPFDRIQRHSFGPAIADDGSPAGFPETDNDKVVDVLRFDEVATGDPLATWVVFGLHPEMLDGNDLVTGEYVHTMYRFVDREVRGLTLFSQNNTGTAEPARNGVAHPIEARAEFSHREYAQMERAARLLADAVETAWTAAGSKQRPEGVEAWVKPAARFEVGVNDMRFAPPSLRFLPTVSNCRAEQLFDGNPPAFPVPGLPTCEFPLEGVSDELPFDPGVTYDMLREAGVPVPDNLGAPSYTGLQETVQVHLQAVRLGKVGITVCPCEQWSDQSKNIKTRLDKKSGNLYVGFDWTAQTTPAGRDWCVPEGDEWRCGDPRTRGATDLPLITDVEYRRMRAHVGNNACSGPGNTDCWDEPANSLRAETDPADPADVWGNYIHEELTDQAYAMVVTVGMSNDYWGYIATLREWARGDHYRKSLTGLGPHSSDFLATRLSRMAAELNGGPEVALTAKDLAYGPENEHQRNRARTVGEVASEYVPLYERTLPADGGDPRVTDQPEDSVERFGAARMAWVGGSNWFDLPEVKVQRWVGPGAADWADFADMTGEVQALVHYPQTDADLAAWRAGQFEWTWEATYEAFSSDVALTDPQGNGFRSTPEGRYRFVVDGVQHDGLGDRAPYHLVSDEFEVRPWGAIQVRNLEVAGGTASFDVAGVLPAGAGLEGGYIDYPDSYASPFRFIRNQRVTLAGGEVFCLECSFRPWADAGVVETATVAVDGNPVATAVCSDEGHCTAEVGDVPPGAVVTVDVVDEYGNTNAGSMG